MTAELKNAVERLYEVFGKYPGNPDMPMSPLNGEPSELNPPLFSKPLHELTSRELAHFSADLIYTWGEESDLKHFLPRILELTAMWDCPAFEVEVFFKKLELTDWQTWPQEEQEAVQHYLICLWIEVLQSDPPVRINVFFLEYMVPIIKYYPNLPALLTAWQELESQVATRRLAELVYWELSWIFSGKMKCFDKKIIDISGLSNWLTSDIVINRLTDAFFVNQSDEAYAEILSFAVRTLEFARSAGPQT